MVVIQWLFSTALLSHTDSFPGSFFLLRLPTSSTHIPILSHELFDCVNIISQLLVEAWKVTVCLPLVALSFLCEPDRQTLFQRSLTCAEHVMMAFVNTLLFVSVDFITHLLRN